MAQKKAASQRLYLKWRRGRDSNSWRTCALDGFQDRCIKPLCHLSGDPRAQNVFYPNLLQRSRTFLRRRQFFPHKKKEQVSNLFPSFVFQAFSIKSSRYKKLPCQEYETSAFSLSSLIRSNSALFSYSY